MTVDIQTEYFYTAPATPRFTAVSSTFALDVDRVFPSASATETVAVLSAFDPATLLSDSTPQKIRFECVVTMPTTFPATGEIRVGLGAFMRSNNRDGFWLTYRRTSGGASAYLELAIKPPTGSAAAEHSLFSVFSPGSITALGVGESATLRMDVTLAGGSVLITGFWNGVQMFVSAPTIAVFNLTTGRSLLNFTTATMYAGIVGNVAGIVGPFPGLLITVTRAYVDSLKVIDIGTLANVGGVINPAPTLSPAPALASIAVTPEDVSGALELTVHPSYVLEFEDQWLVDEHPYDGGYAASVAQQTRRRRAFHFHWRALSEAQRTTLDDLWDDADGRTLSFAWTSPETGLAMQLKFTTQLEVVLIAPGVWQANVDVREQLTGA